MGKCPFGKKLCSDLNFKEPSSDNLTGLIRLLTVLLCLGWGSFLVSLYLIRFVEGSQVHWIVFSLCFALLVGRIRGPFIAKQILRKIDADSD